ncbi:MAG TPA: polyprenol monophosphomannose synthase [Candidatus Limnocylindrales bacterium]|nr:polyprenol monophosphomannose synthase [Candidatus Limnocylindrales bacterium]
MGVAAANHSHPGIVIPTYNESENIERLVAEILALPVGAHVVVVDDNSPDGTGELLDKLAAVEPRLHVVHRPAKLGLGTAHIAGIRKADALGLDPIGTMDADFSHHPRYIPNLIAGLAHNDVMIGSRYVAGGGTKDFGLHRQLLSRTANTFARTMLGLTSGDCTAGFRLYRRETLASIDLDSIFSNGYSFLIEILFLVQAAGWKVGESPILFEDRREGISKISRKEIAKAVYTVLRLFAQRGRIRGGVARPASRPR